LELEALWPGYGIFVARFWGRLLCLGLVVLRVPVAILSHGALELGWLHEIFFGMFGASGDIVLYSSVGTAFMLFGALKFRATQ
jgi:hypothetical protein